MQCWQCKGEVSEEHLLGGLCFFCAPEDVNNQRDRDRLDEPNEKRFRFRRRPDKPLARTDAPLPKAPPIPRAELTKDRRPADRAGHKPVEDPAAVS